MKKVSIQWFFILVFLLEGLPSSFAQIKVGNNPGTLNKDAVLEIESADRGLLIPRLELKSLSLSDPLKQHVEGMVVYNTITDAVAKLTPGLYYNTGSQWVRVAVPSLSLSNRTLSIAENNSVTLPADSSIYNMDGALTGNRTIHTGTNSLTFRGSPPVTFYNTNATPNTITASIPVSTLYRLGIGGQSYPQVVNFDIGKYANGITASTQLDIKMTDGGTSTPDVTVMTLRGNGNVGIGTNSPGERLTIGTTTGNPAGFSITNGDGNFRVGVAGTPGHYEAIAKGDVSISNQSNKGIGIFTNTSMRMYITNTGNVGIGTSAPAEKLDVDGNIRCNALILASDATLKQNISSLSNVLPSLLKIGAYSYHWKDPSASSDLQYGVLAQEVEKVFPHLVITHDDHKAVNYSQLIPLLIQAIKEQQIQIDSLQRRNKRTGIAKIFAPKRH